VNSEGTMNERIAAKGTWGTVEWAIDARLRLPAQEFFLSLDASDQRKIAALFQWLASEGRVPNREKFKGLGVQGGGLWEFKSFQIRFLGDFRPGARFLVALGLRKKQDALRPADVQAAVRILAENDVIEKGGKR
jgi:hypothetical protein